MEREGWGGGERESHTALLATCTLGFCLLCNTPLYKAPCGVVAEEEGKEVEAAMNAMGPGEATFVSCDMSKEEEIKVFSAVCMLCLTAT